MRTSPLQGWKRERELSTKRHGIYGTPNASCASSRISGWLRAQNSHPRLFSHFKAICRVLANWRRMQDALPSMPDGLRVKQLLRLIWPFSMRARDI
jgi:hypothetical protein